jgi:hypothetical protein
VVKYCRACHTGIVDEAAVCPSCGLQQLIFPAAVSKLQRVWNFAGFCVAALGVVSVSLAVGVVRHHGSPAHWNPQKLLVRSKRNVVYRRSIVLVEETRKVYPYSIVPGGAPNVDEAKLAMLRGDVRANYTNVDFAKLHEVKLTANLSGYVSYRYGDKIYWTAKKLTLRAGETVFTDGQHIVRGRCLNCYSVVPMSPIRPHEPSEKVLNAPVDVPVYAYKFPMLPVETPMLPPPPEELTPTVPILPAVAPVKPGGGFWFPIIPIIPPIHHHPGSSPVTPSTPGSPGPPGTPPGTPPVIPPVAVVPEPNYAWLLAAGFLALALTHVLRRRASLRLPNLSKEKRQPGGTSVVEP